MNGEDTIDQTSTHRSNFEIMFDINLQKIPLLYEAVMHNINVFRQSEISAMKLMPSDENELRDEIVRELAKAKELRKKKFPVRSFMHCLKAMVWPR